MRIALHTPLNPFDDERISGDRRMARQLAMALRDLGHVVAPVADARSYLATPDPAALAALIDTERARCATLLESWRRSGGAPDLWFTYHSYYKAPDLLGPVIAEALSIPLMVAEASDSERRAEGEWAAHVALARESFGKADLHLSFTARDRAGVEPWCGPLTAFVSLPPFIAALPPAAAAMGDGAPRLVTVAMMRPGAKHDSYLALAATLARLAERPWTISIIGDGAMRAEIEAAFAGLPEGRVQWLGALDHTDVVAQLARHDIFVWPGLNEAYGLVYLEAQGAGLPVVAFDSGGVSSTVKRDVTAFLATAGATSALADALGRLLDDAGLRGRMGCAARAFVDTERTMPRAREVLAEALVLAAQRHDIARRRPQHSPKAASQSDDWAPLIAELDLWAAVGRRVDLWLRDDDAVAATPALDRLADLAARFEIPVLLAVIPLLAERSLVMRLKNAPWLLACQHGCAHVDHAGPGAKKSEFGPQRPLGEVAEEIARARRRLDDLLEGGTSPVFVPPWNRVTPEIAAMLPGLGFSGLSCFRGFDLGPGGGPRLVNTDLDIVDWQHGRVGRPTVDLVGEMTALLQARRNATGAAALPFGVLMHHRDHDETAWSFLEGLLRAAGRHEALRLADPHRLFAPAAAA